MRFAFIDVEKAHYPMRILCRTLRVSRSGYYAWRSRKPSDRMLEDERLRPKVVEAFKTGSGTYGSPRVRDELVDHGVEIGRKRVARLMRELGLRGVSPRKFRVTTNSDHEHPVAENVLNRNFEASNQGRNRQSHSGQWFVPACFRIIRRSLDDSRRTGDRQTEQFSQRRSTVAVE